MTKEKEKWMEEFKNKFRLNDGMIVNGDERLKEMSDWWLTKLSSKHQELKREIERIKEAVSKRHGAIKYDSCYDDCLSAIDRVYGED